LKWKFIKWPTSCFLSSSIWKWLFIKNLIYRILIINAWKLRKLIYDMIIIKKIALFTNLVQSYGITRFHKYYKFQYFLEYIFIFKYTITHFFDTNIFKHHIRWNFKMYIFSIDFFLFWPIAICKNIMKIYFSNDMVEFKHGHPWKVIWCKYIILHPIMRFHPITKSNVCN
jgi:hypothetical protein